MLYRQDKHGNMLSQLGFGCMRFARKGAGIDYEATKAQIVRAYEAGINYYDTAYIYPGSEETLGRILEETGLRDRVNIATKLPQYLMRSAAAIDKTFAEELARLRTDRIDYYLMHMFTDISEWENLQRLGIEDWFSARRAEGKIRNVGFSYHGNSEMFIKILNAYDWDFCQIQYNYLDEHSQAGRRGLMAAAEKGIPVIIMEPLRGGKLVRLPADAKEMLEKSEKGYSPAELGLRWLWNQSAVTCVLSGMNSLEMVEENCAAAASAEAGCFDEEDFVLVEKIKAIFAQREKVGCTGCRYCMPCPRGVDIPGTFYYYNLMYMEKKTPARFEYIQAVGMRKQSSFASQCIGCGKCEKHCPQQLPIREKLKEADKALRPLPLKLVNAIERKIMIK